MLLDIILDITCSCRSSSNLSPIMLGKLKMAGKVSLPAMSFEPIQDLLLHCMIVSYLHSLQG